MNVCYNIKNASRAKQSDLIKALSIYSKTVDKFAQTDTNQIMDYISKRYDENRIMFFFVLYLNGEVCGFAEYAYLKKNKVLMLDYLCTESRNHTLFYNFYQMIFEEINRTLNSKQLFIEFIVTELSLLKHGKKLIETDSNYFRQILSFEQFHILNIPYKQPCMGKTLEFFEYSLAIKKADSCEDNSYVYNKNFYMSLISEIYEEHYLQWYLHYTDNKKEIIETFNNSLALLNNEYPPEAYVEEIYSVNCRLFDKGICNQIKPETITLSKQKKKNIRKYLVCVIWVALSLSSILLCYFQDELSITKYISTLVNAISMITGIIALLTIVKNKIT